MSRRIVISGYYGFGNAGDEAVLAGMLTTFRKLEIDVEVTVLSADPARTVAEHPGVQSAHRYRILDLIRAIRGADLLISGGGSLLQDATSARSAQYYLGILRLAQFFKCRTMIYAQGIGPLNRPAIRRKAVRVLNRVNLITVRDQDSRTLLESMGVSVPEVEVVADPSFMVEPDLERAAKLVDGPMLSGQELVGVSLRSWRKNEWLESALEGISQACDEIEAKPVVIPMQQTEDAQVCKGLKSGALIQGTLDPALIKGVIASCGLMVGMRLHSLIFAADVGVSFVPIVYDPKVTSFAKSMGRNAGMDVSAPDSSQLKTEILRAWHDRERSTVKMGELAARQREMAVVSGTLAKQFLMIG